MHKNKTLVARQPYRFTATLMSCGVGGGKTLANPYKAHSVLLPKRKY